MEKSLYPLCGSNIPLESWVQPLHESANVFNISTNEDIIGAGPHPLRYWRQVPSRWFKEDPGFKILLRDKCIDKSVVPKWFIPPERYSFEPLENKTESGTLLIICHHNTPMFKWEEIQENYKNFHLIWTGYALDELPDWPENHFYGFRDILFSARPICNAFIDINYWQRDTLSPLHIHLLHTGVKLMNLSRTIQARQLIRTTFYGSYYLH